MNDSYTHITLVVDRSGSMAAVCDDAQGAINTFVAEQQKLDGKATLTLVEFDAPHGALPGEDDWYHVVFDGDIQRTLMYELRPRGSTALLDAVGMAITATGEKLKALDEAERPGKVVFVIQTDGQENSSRDWTWEKAQEVIKRQSEQFNWQFVFLGMGSDAWDQGHRLGVSNVVRAADSGVAHAHTHSVMNAYVADYRSGHAHDLAAANVSVDARGRILNEHGEEVDPVTGKVVGDIQA
jgi:Mg-chelatase subunit ChlD